MSPLNLERGLPASVDAERAILGAVLLDNEALFEVCEELSPENFSLESHRRIFARVLELSEASGKVDPITLCEELSKRGETESVGGVAYISSLMDGLPRRPSIAQYVRIVRDKAALRQIVHTADAVSVRALEQADSPDQIVSDFESDLLSISAGTQADDAVHIAVACHETIDGLLKTADSEQTVGYSTGIATLDEQFSGWVPGELTYIGARPGVGKTSAVIKSLCANGEQQIPCLFFSLEMTRVQIIKRMIALVGDINAVKLRKPWFLTAEDKLRMRKAQRIIEAWPIYINDRSALTPQQILAKSKLYIRRHGVKIVFVDFFTRMRLDGKDFRLAANAGSRILAQLAKDEKVPVICLSQLRRAENEEREPQLSDLKETGNLEEDAHVALLLHRPRRDGEYTHEDKVIIAKAREGALGAVKVTYDGSRLAFMPR